MKLSRNVSALAVALVVNVLLVILLTPLGFETRPSADLKTVGYIAIGTIFAGLILDVASFALLFRRVRLASSLAIVGSILLFFPIFVDQTDSFDCVTLDPSNSGPPPHEMRTSRAADCRSAAFGFSPPAGAIRARPE